MNANLLAKEQQLRAAVAECASAVVAFSGGVDSTYLVYLTHDVLGKRMLAVTAQSASVPQFQLDDARKFVAERGIPFLLIETDELANPAYRENSPQRCYYCKHELFSQCLKIARERGFEFVFDGSNADDTGDYRPGMSAAKELKVRSPLMEAGMTKGDIRALSKHHDLPTWDIPAFACMASRFPYGTNIDAEKLRQVEQAEMVLRNLGFRQYRVRYHGEVARIELARNELERVLSFDMFERISAGIRAAGFTYAALDMEGYRSGSLNETLELKRSESA